MAHIRSLSQQLDAAAAAHPTPGGSLQVREVVVGAVPPPLQDDNVSMISEASSAATSFAGGERAIEVYLRETRTIVNAEIKAWRMKIETFAGKKQHEIELMDDEDIVTAVEDCDQLKREIGRQLKTWVVEACNNLTVTDP